MKNSARGRARKIALTGLLTALSTALLYLAALIPTSYIGTVAAASLLTAAAVIETGFAAGALVFAGTAILGFLLVPLKSAVLLYALFFGYYPLVKSLAERLKSRAAEWLLKLASVNAALSVMLFALRGLVFSGAFFEGSAPLVYLAVNACFVLYDIGLSRLIVFYCARISKYGHHG